MSKHLNELRREASSRGIPWEWVQQAHEQLREAEIEARRDDLVREAAWCIACGCTPGCWPFWRNGFVSRWGKRVEASDYTAVPGYDSIQEQVAAMFPDYADPDRLWDMLFSAYVPRKRPAQLWEEALAWAIDESQRELVPAGAYDADDTF